MFCVFFVADDRKKMLRLWRSDVVKNRRLPPAKTKRQQTKSTFHNLMRRQIDKRFSDISNKFVPICSTNKRSKLKYIYQNEININV